MKNPNSDAIQFNSQEQMDRNTQNDAPKENPFWFQDVSKAPENNFSKQDGDQQNGNKNNKNTRRAKRNHHKNLKKLQNIHSRPASEHIISKRSIQFSLDDYPNDEQFYVESVDIISNLLNENDSISSGENFDEDDFSLFDENKHFIDTIHFLNESFTNLNKNFSKVGKSP